MSKGWAIACGVAALFCFSVLVYDAGWEAWTGHGLPRFITAIIVLITSVLSNVATVYLVVRGRTPDPAYTKDELAKLVQASARAVIREELELATGRAYVNMAGLSPEAPTATPHIPAQRNVFRMTREGD